ncbi:heparinase II/III family protein [Roseinatronobacter sp.]
MSLGLKLRTYARLGPSSLARVASYRLGLRVGVHPVLKLRADTARGPFLRAPRRSTPAPAPNSVWNDALWWFGWYRTDLPADPPDWFANPFSDQPQPDASRDWWCIPDFGSGDIKGLWELSRFDWVVVWATCAANGDRTALDRLNHWIADWAEKNPPYKGPNWKCGQEASIRVMHLVLAAWVLGQDKAPDSGLVALIRAHLQRIAPTMSYAIGQQNNHGTSEAAALFIGGSFLAGHDARAKGWMAKGRYWLEERAQALIERDGSFSQHSVTYHRVMLDSYALAEAWRRHSDLPGFSPALQDRLAAATRWLQVMTIPETGDAPNIGANDGARLIQLTGSDYRDFRPSVQLAAALFEGRDAYGAGVWNAPLQWLGIPAGQPGKAPDSASFDKGGYHVLRAGAVMAVLRYPRFRFRPSQADALHLDLWLGGENLLRDAGTFSYNMQGAEWFGGTSAHNTVTFDGRDQMPRLGRFLFGHWVRAEDVVSVQTGADGVSAAAAYTDRQGARHHRHVLLVQDTLICTDTISGSFTNACLRWRLVPREWALEGQQARAGGTVISLGSDSGPLDLTLTKAPESRYYQHRDDIPVLEIGLNRPCTIVTKVEF